jgi:hypothetical protein
LFVDTALYQLKVRKIAWPSLPTLGSLMLLDSGGVSWVLR